MSQLWCRDVAIMMWRCRNYDVTMSRLWCDDVAIMMSQCHNYDWLMSANIINVETIDLNSSDFLLMSINSSQLFSVLFFLVLITLGLGSATALVSVSITIMHDDFGHLVPPVAITVSMCIACFFLGLVFVTPVSTHTEHAIDCVGLVFVTPVSTHTEHALCLRSSWWQ